MLWVSEQAKIGKNKVPDTLRISKKLAKALLETHNRTKFAEYINLSRDNIHLKESCRIVANWKEKAWNSKEMRK